MVEEEKSDEKNGPLSREGWIMLLSSEINKVEMKLATYWNAGLIILIALLSVTIAALAVRLQSDGPLIEVVSKILALSLIISGFLVMVIYETCYRSSHQKRLKTLINTREAIISGELTDFGEIHRKWEEYIKKYYGRLLEKSEMDGEKNGLNVGAENSKKIDSEKGVNEQKKKLQISQSDMKDINDSLQEIKDTLKGSETFSMLSILGSYFIAIGILGISIGFALQTTGSYDRLLLLLVGLLLFSSGALMISSIEPNVEAFKKLCRDKKRFRLAVLLILLAMLIIIFALFSIAIQIFF